MPGETPSQTVGPFWAIGLPWDGDRYAVDPDRPGAVRIVGTVYDGEGEPVPDAIVETWQADPPTGDGFRGFARCGSDEGAGAYEIVTLRPGPVDGQAPHIDVSVFARGMLNRVVTRIYFADEAEANAADPVLASVPADRRATLLAQPSADGYAIDLRIQGERETVFFSV
jgi:protocatechuate 3,4-dioxygenase alpha subunit